MQLKPKQITGISSDRDPLTFFTCQTMELLLHFDFYLVWRHELISFSIALLTTGRLTIGRRTISLGSVWQWASNHCRFWNLLPHSWSGSLIFPFQLYDTGQQFLCAIDVHLFLICSFQIDWSILLKAVDRNRTHGFSAFFPQSSSCHLLGTRSVYHSREGC